MYLRYLRSAGVMSAFRKSYFVRDRVPPLKVKEDIVNYAKYKWPLLFSRFYEAYKFAGECKNIPVPFLSFKNEHTCTCTCMSTCS